MEVRRELENMLHHEELLWHQKARCDWLVLSDCNTKFFHTCTLKRRNQSKITTLKNEEGEWIMDEEQLKLEAVNFNMTLYGERPSSMRGLPLNPFLCLTDKDFNLLNNLISDEEIKAALFHMAPLKAIGSDGYHIFFLTKSMRSYSVSLMVLWNGVPTSKFWPARRIQQGCHLSHYLFIFCMEWLAHSIRAAINAGNRDPICLARNGSPVSYLFSQMI
ncbi:hypothetical protein J1N35_023175 [Gossypium stocksii]|uniref:Reverse transcriptase domain-containing protein n=1 Tax=Gossypium stocksii TaxID=47602 RepID=A0A9D3VJ47_9ROSI|nr:hypothetical protein J1N35_023175 [Gossypium stocksii]